MLTPKISMTLGYNKKHLFCILCYDFYLLIKKEITIQYFFLSATYSENRHVIISLNETVVRQSHYS